jgi:DNA repair protein SbcC/Rad50
MSTYSPVGSLWNKCDLHFHTPSSFDYENKGISNQEIIDKLVASGIRVVAITDHHTMDVGRIRELLRNLSSSLNPVAFML